MTETGSNTLGDGAAVWDETRIRRMGQVHGAPWGKVAGILGQPASLMQRCCRDYTCSISSRSQVLCVPLWGRREFTVLGYKSGRYKPKEKGVCLSSRICRMIKVRTRDKPDWRKSRDSEF